MIQLHATGITEVRLELKSKIDRLNDLTPAMQAAGQAIRKFVDDRFRTSTAPDGHPWRPLADSTLKRRRKGRGRGGPKILIDTSRLKESIHVVADAHGVEVGTKVEYAIFHQYGTEVDGELRMSARPFLPYVIGPGGEIEEWREGPAAKLWDRVQKYIDSYVDTGKLAA